MFTHSQDPSLNHILPPCLACVFFFLRSSFVGGIIHSAARKLECECHVSVHFDQMRALFGCETQTADSSYAGKMSREPPSNTQHSSFVSAIAFEEKMASPRTPALLTLRRICPSSLGGPGVNYPSRHLPHVSHAEAAENAIHSCRDGKRLQRTIRLSSAVNSLHISSPFSTRMPDNKSHTTQGLSHHRPIKLMNGGF